MIVYSKWEIEGKEDRNLQHKLLEKLAKHHSISLPHFGVKWSVHTTSTMNNISTTKESKSATNMQNMSIKAKLI